MCKFVHFLLLVLRNLRMRRVERCFVFVKRVLVLRIGILAEWVIWVEIFLVNRKVYEVCSHWVS